MRKNKTDPQTAAEWQDAVDGAAGFRAIEDARMYGLIQGGPKVDIARCDEILERGAARGITPSRNPIELAIGLVRAINGDGHAG